jgi:hypothetical protein
MSDATLYPHTRRFFPFFLPSFFPQKYQQMMIAFCKNMQKIPINDDCDILFL